MTTTKREGEKKNAATASPDSAESAAAAVLGEMRERRILTHSTKVPAGWKNRNRTARWMALRRATTAENSSMAPRNSATARAEYNSASLENSACRAWAALDETEARAWVEKWGRAIEAHTNSGAAAQTEP